MSEGTPIVGVLAASPNELPIMRQAGLILEKFGIPNEVQIMSSSRTPDLVDEYARTALERGLRVVVCSTGRFRMRAKTRPPWSRSSRKPPSRG